MNDFVDVTIFTRGIRLIVNPGATDYEAVPRTWRERLFSWPWRPSEATKDVYRPGGYIRADGSMIISPLTMYNICEALFEAETNILEV